MYQKGFTLIELLVVVAIIGILAAVGTPIFQGFMADAKVNATRENHTRAKDMISAYITKCSISGNSVQLKNNSGKFVSVNCTPSDFAKGFSVHFNAEGWKNPYETEKNCCSSQKWKHGQGFTNFGSDGNSVVIYSNFGKQDGGHNYVRTLVKFE
jgi:type IV pilus assembly protein PilA